MRCAVGFVMVLCACASDVRVQKAAGSALQPFGEPKLSVTESPCDGGECTVLFDSRMGKPDSVQEVVIKVTGDGNAAFTWRVAVCTWSGVKEFQLQNSWLTPQVSEGGTSQPARVVKCDEPVTSNAVAEALTRVTWVDDDGFPSLQNAFASADQLPLLVHFGVILAEVKFTDWQNGTAELSALIQGIEALLKKPSDNDAVETLQALLASYGSSWHWISDNLRLPWSADRKEDREKAFRVGDLWQGSIRYSDTFRKFAERVAKRPSAVESVVVAAERQEGLLWRHNTWTGASVSLDFHFDQAEYSWSDRMLLKVQVSSPERHPEQTAAGILVNQRNVLQSIQTTEYNGVHAKAVAHYFGLPLLAKFFWTGQTFATAVFQKPPGVGGKEILWEVNEQKGEKKLEKLLILLREIYFPTLFSPDLVPYVYSDDFSVWGGTKEDQEFPHTVDATLEALDDGFFEPLKDFDTGGTLRTAVASLDDRDEDENEDIPPEYKEKIEKAVTWLFEHVWWYSPLMGPYDKF